MNERLPKKAAIAELKRTVARSGVKAGLVFLNGLTSHRFSALYRFDDRLLKNLFFFDREHPEREISEEIPVLSSYCVFVRDSRQNFTVENSLTDDRTVKHPKRLEIIAYCGVPLLDGDGKMFGTICHFDVAPRSIDLENVELMEELATVLKSQIRKL